MPQIRSNQSAISLQLNGNYMQPVSYNVASNCDKLLKITYMLHNVHYLRRLVHEMSPLVQSIHILIYININKISIFCIPVDTVYNIPHGKYYNTMPYQFFFPNPILYMFAMHLFHCFQIVWFLFDKLTMNQIWQAVKLLSTDCFTVASTVLYVWHDTANRWTFSFQHDASGHCRKVCLEHRFTLAYDFVVQKWIWYTALRLGNWKLLKTAWWMLEAHL